MARSINTRWELNLRDRDLKKVGRDGAAELLIGKVNEVVDKVDLSEGAMFLEEDFSLKVAIRWVEMSFGIQLEIDSLRSLSASELIDHICDEAEKVYDEKESEYPVMAGFYRFGAGSESSRIDREGLLEWARERFSSEISMDDIKNKGERTERMRR